MSALRRTGARFISLYISLVTWWSSPSFHCTNKIGPLSYLTERSHSFYYYFDGYIGKHWSTHDPMGRTEPNQKKNVVDLHGNIFIRAEWQRHSNKTTHISFRGDWILKIIASENWQLGWLEERWHQLSGHQAHDWYVKRSTGIFIFWTDSKLWTDFLSRQPVLLFSYQEKRIGLKLSSFVLRLTMTVYGYFGTMVG